MLPYQNLSLENMPSEVWKDLPGYEGYYQISNYGRAKALKRTVICANNKYTKILPEHIIKQSVINDRHYLSFVACRSNVAKRVYLHRAVAILFVPNKDSKPCVDHINTITFDNRASNLRWVTMKENACNPLTKQHTSKAKSGKNCFFYGKTFGTRRIKCKYPDGNEKVYNSIIEASRCGFTYRAIQYCLSGVYKSHKNCTFTYVG